MRSGRSAAAAPPQSSPIPPSASVRSPSQSSDVSMEPSAYSGFNGLGGSRGGGGGGGGIAGLNDGDYKDTVLYMQQQQSMNHTEMMEMMRQLMVRVSNVEGRGGSAPGQQQPQPAVQVPQGPVTEDTEMPPLGADYAAHRFLQDQSSGDNIVGGFTNTSTSADIQLRAAKGKIETLEALVSSLQSQVQKQEITIRQLTEANIANVKTMTSSSSVPDTSFRHSQLNRSSGSSYNPATGSSSSVRLGTPQKAIDLHRQSLDKLFTGVPSSSSPAPSRAIPSTIGDAASTPGGGAPHSSSSYIAGGGAGGGFDSSSVSSPTVRELLSQHQQRCAQVMLQ